MTLLDREGRVFGRLNLIDAAIVALLVVLIPIGYATYLLFRPSKPSIASVTRVEVGKEERRVAGGSLLTAKLKVKGSGFNPLLRASIGSTSAIGFVFETPNSVDVLVGVVPPGRHDLVLFDGVQEVARARGAVEIQATTGPSLRAYGWLTNLAAGDATFKPGLSSDPSAPGAFSVIAIGEERPARARIAVGSRAADLPLPGGVERAAEILVRCDWPSGESCVIGGQSLTQPPPITVTLPGGLRFEIDEIAPPSEPRAATARVRLAAPIAGMKVGDRDAIVGMRAATITAIVTGSQPVISLRVGVDESRDGWRYRGQLLTPGAAFVLRTASYEAGGTVIDMSVDPKGAPQ